MQVRKIGTPIAVISVLSYLVLGPANADESVTITRTTTSVGDPRSVATTEVPGSIVYFRTIPPATLVTTLEVRRRDLEHAIDQARDRGEISNAQCVAMKQELKRIAAQTGSNTITYPAAVMLAQDLDLIGQQYGTIVTAAPSYIPIITGTHIIISGKTYELDDLSTRRAGLESRITKDLLQGRLSPSRADQLRIQLAGIGTEANLYTGDGNFDPKESRRLYDAFDHVASEIEKSAGKDSD